MEIIGHCRFSWLGISDTGRDLITRDNAKQILWDPSRMAIRFLLFERIMLPSIRAQSDQDFRLVIIISEDLPAVYHDRLETLVAADPNIEIFRTSEQSIGRALRPIMLASTDGDRKAVHFRIDDDDALCSGYIARIRAIMAKHDLDAATAISFPRGVTAFLHDGQAKHAECLKSFIAIGLAFVNDVAFRRNPYEVQHRKVGQRMQNYVDPTFLAFQHTLHLANNTSGYADDVLSRPTTSSGARRILRNNPQLQSGQVVDPDLDQRIGGAFTGTDGATLRRGLEKSLDCENLAQEFGFM